MKTILILLAFVVALSFSPLAMANSHGEHGGHHYGRGGGGPFILPVPGPYWGPYYGPDYVPVPVPNETWVPGYWTTDQYGNKIWIPGHYERF